MSFKGSGLDRGPRMVWWSTQTPLPSPSILFKLGGKSGESEQSFPEAKSVHRPEAFILSFPTFLKWPRLKSWQQRITHFISFVWTTDSCMRARWKSIHMPRTGDGRTSEKLDVTLCWPLGQPGPDWMSYLHPGHLWSSSLKTHFSKRHTIHAVVPERSVGSPSRFPRS